MSAPLGHVNALCDSVDALYTSSKTLRILFALETGTSLLAILCLVLMIFLLLAWRMYSVNVRILTVSFCASLIVANVFVMISAVYHLQAIIMRPKEDRCHWLAFNYSECYFMKQTTNILMFVVYSGAAAFSLERIINSLAAPPQAVKNAVAGFLVGLQFLSSIFVIIRFPTKSETPTERHSHCVAFFPNIVQMKHFFPIIMAMEIFTLAVYSVLQSHFFALKSQHKRASIALYRAIVDTEVSLPIVLASIALFLTNVFLDRDVLLAVQSLFPELQILQQTRQVGVLARWNELQALSLPVFSLAIFALIVRHAWRVDSASVYDKALSDCAHSLKTYYETMTMPRTLDAKPVEELYRTVEKPKQASPKLASDRSPSTVTKSAPNVASAATTAATRNTTASVDEGVAL